MLANDGTIKSIWSDSGNESVEDRAGKNSTKSVPIYYNPSWWDSEKDDDDETRKQPKLESTHLEYESDDSQNTYCESLDDFAAIPVEFRPKKVHTKVHKKTDLFLGMKRDEKIPSPSVERESSSSGADKSKCSSETKGTIHHEGKNFNSKLNSGGISKSVAARLFDKEKTGTKSVSSNSDKQTTNKKKISFDHPIHTEMHSTDSSIEVKKNSTRKEPTFRKEFSKLSFDTLRISDEIKTNKPIWDNNMSFYKEKSKVWKFEEYPLRRQVDDSKQLSMDTDAKVKGIRSKEMGNNRPKTASAGNRRTLTWDDNMCLFKNTEKRVDFQYISKEVKDGSSTYTACWGNVHQRTGRTAPRRSVIGDNAGRKYGGKKQTSVSVRGNTTPQKQVETEAKKQFRPSTKGREKSMNANLSKNSKTKVIRHEIKVIHVNQPPSETKDSSSESINEAIWKKVVSESAGKCILEFGKNANAGEKQLNFNVSKVDMEHNRSALIRYGKEMSDLIVGSYVGTMALLSFYHKWIPIRDKTIRLLEQLADNISNLKRRNGKIENVANLLEGGGKVVGIAPDLRFAIAGKMITAITSVIAKLFQSTPNLEHSGVKESELMRFVQEDIETTSDVYTYGVQCDQQFQEVCKLIEEFQHFIDTGNLTTSIEVPEADFIQEMLHFSPHSYIVYYRKLYKCFEKLKDRQTSDVSKAFCRAFEFSPEALTLINQLHWRFHAQITDSEASERAWGEVCMLLGSSNSTSQILQKIQDCVKVLIRERNIMEKNIEELIKYKI